MKNEIKKKIEMLFRRAQPYLSEYEDGCIVGYNDALEDVLNLLDEFEEPDKVDEAAQKYVESTYDTESISLLERNATVRHFKAGAEWLAEQGETDSFQVLMDEVHMYGDSNMPSKKFPYCYMKLPGGIEGNYYLGEEFKEGDELIVQIRKK